MTILLLLLLPALTLATEVYICGWEYEKYDCKIVEEEKPEIDYKEVNLTLKNLLDESLDEENYDVN